MDAAPGLRDWTRRTSCLGRKGSGGVRPSRRDNPGRFVMERRRLLASVGCVVGLAVSLHASRALAQPAWTFLGQVAQGGQIDALAGPGGRVHLLSSHYYQFDSDGNVLVDEAVGDERQGGMDFPPAMALGQDGSVHILTRHGGDWNSGHDIRYRRRNASGTWDRDFVVGSREKRNYVVGLALAGPGQVVAAYTVAGDNVWGDVKLFDVGGGSGQFVGSIGGIWRSDCDARLRGASGRVFLVSGKPDGNGQVAYFLQGDAGSGLLGELEANKDAHVMGSGRTGFADLFVDPTGSVHMVYGAYQSLYYNKYRTDGSKVFPDDREVFTDLNEWHLSSGLGAVAASDDGSVVVAVALRTDGSKEAGTCDILWAYSTDGGDTWSAPQDTGRDTDGGEGRRRPRLVALGRRFFLFYVDKSASGISLGLLDVVTDADSDGYASDQDCDDGDPDIHPGAQERCNGRDDDCDGTTDEGCEDATVPLDAQPDAVVLADGGMDGHTDGASSQGDAALEHDASSVRGGCDCQAAGADQGLFFVLVFWMPLLLHFFRQRG